MSDEEGLEFKYIKISELGPNELKLEYGPSEENFVCIDLRVRISAMNLETIPVSEVFVRPFKFNPNVGYTTSDRSETHRIARPIGGSLGVDMILPDGRKGSCYLVESFHYEDDHHNPEIWSYDFDGKPGYDKTIQYHDAIPLNQPLYVKLTVGNNVLCTKYVATGEIRKTT